MCSHQLSSSPLLRRLLVVAGLRHGFSRMMSGVVVVLYSSCGKVELAESPQRHSERYSYDHRLLLDPKDKATREKKRGME